MRKVLLFLAALSAAAPAAGCRRGPHVDVTHEGTTLYRCSCSEDWWREERTVAVCRAAEECAATCARLDARCDWRAAAADGGAR